MRLSAKQVHDKLINEDKILTLQGQIQFQLGDVSIIVKQKDVVGNIMQEWLQGWLDSKGIEYAPSENTQMPPDFFLNPDDRTKDLLEIKAFNRNASPGFDIADFRMYQSEIINKPYMLDVDYLIFGYDMTEDGYVIIRDVWLKKVWEITRRMETWPLNLQIKEGHVHKIRPGVWYSERAVDYPMFRTMEDFISAIEECVFKNEETHSLAPTWRNRFIESYRKETGKTLKIPRWYEIEEEYNYKKIKKIEKAQKDIEKASADLQKAIEKLDELKAAYSIIEVDGKENQIKKSKGNVDKQMERVQLFKERLNVKKEILEKLR